MYNTLVTITGTTIQVPFQVKSQEFVWKWASATFHWQVYAHQTSHSDLIRIRGDQDNSSGYGHQDNMPYTLLFIWFMMMMMYVQCITLHAINRINPPQNMSLTIMMMGSAMRNVCCCHFFFMRDRIRFLARVNLRFMKTKSAPNSPPMMPRSMAGTIANRFMAMLVSTWSNIRWY